MLPGNLEFGKTRLETETNPEEEVPASASPRNENDEMRLEKVISEGGSLTLAETSRFGIRARAARDLMENLDLHVNSATLAGHTDQYPRIRYDGIHVCTGEELAKKADVCLLAITDIEFQTVAEVLEHQEALPPRGIEFRRLIVGYRGNTVCLVGQPFEKRAIKAYGIARDLFALGESARFCYKVGGAAGRNEIGTISILARGRDGVVLRDHYNQRDIFEGQGFPSPTALQFSYQPFEGPVARNSATCGPKEIVDYAESPTDTYEWEFAGVKAAADASHYHGELGMISVVTDNYGVLGQDIDVQGAFRRLATFVARFLDSDMLA